MWRRMGLVAALGVAAHGMAAPCKAELAQHLARCARWLYMRRLARLHRWPCIPGSGRLMHAAVPRTPTAAAPRRATLPAGACRLLLHAFTYDRVFTWLQLALGAVHSFPMFPDGERCEGAWWPSAAAPWPPTVAGRKAASTACPWRLRRWPKQCCSCPRPPQTSWPCSALCTHARRICLRRTLPSQPPDKPPICPARAVYAMVTLTAQTAAERAVGGARPPVFPAAPPAPAGAPAAAAVAAAAAAPSDEIVSGGTAYTG